MQVLGHSSAHVHQQYYTGILTEQQRTAQAAMRHSDPSLTANVYTDPKLLDVTGALDKLPFLPLTPMNKSRPTPF